MGFGVNQILRIHPREGNAEALPIREDAQPHQKVSSACELHAAAVAIVENQPLLSPTKGLTVQCWVKTDQPGQSDRWIANPRVERAGEKVRPADAAFQERLSAAPGVGDSRPAASRLCSLPAQSLRDSLWVHGVTTCYLRKLVGPKVHSFFQRRAQPW